MDEMIKGNKIMSRELERKFILTKDHATEIMERRLVFGVFKIFQGYFNLDDPNNEFRIRLSYPDTYHPKLSSFLTIKSKDINCGKRNEFEFSISAQDAFHTISKDCKKFIEKTRYLIQFNTDKSKELIAELNVFNKELIILEIEFTSEKDMNEFIPNFEFENEVTNDDSKYGINLANEMSKEDVTNILKEFKVKYF